MEKRTIEVYTFAELKPEVQQMVIERDRERYTYLDFLPNEITEYLHEKLMRGQIKELGETKLNYSLSYSQGDGVSFTGRFKWGRYYVDISRNTSHYYHSNSTSINLYKDEYLSEYAEGKTAEKAAAKIKEAYDEICNQIEKVGYAEIEYQSSDEAIKDTLLNLDTDYYIDGRVV